MELSVTISSIVGQLLYVLFNIKQGTEQKLKIYFEEKTHKFFTAFEKLRWRQQKSNSAMH